MKIFLSVVYIDCSASFYAALDSRDFRRVPLGFRGT